MGNHVHRSMPADFLILVLFFFKKRGGGEADRNPFDVVYSCRLPM